MNTKPSPNPAAHPTAFTTAPPSARNCHQLGVCLHPVRACAQRCEQQALQQLRSEIEPLVQPRSTEPATAALPFGIEGPYRPRPSRADRWRFAAWLLVWLVSVSVLVLTLLNTVGSQS